MSIPSGWYPNPDGSPSQRWWDGVSWSQQVRGSQQSYVVAAPTGVSAATIPFWLNGLTPLLPLLVYVVWDVHAFIRLSSDTALLNDPGTLLTAVAATGYFNVFWVYFLTWVVSIVLALLDYRTLRARGVPKPFHWAFAFIPSLPVYLIGRPVVASRRGARGSRGAVILYIVAYIVTGVLSIVIVNASA